MLKYEKETQNCFHGNSRLCGPSLKILIENQFSVVAVVTAPDKPSGRGRKLSSSAVKQFSIEHNLPVLQPVNLKSEDFISQIKSYKPDLFIVVAFRCYLRLSFPYPDWVLLICMHHYCHNTGGAAPINHAIMNGEKETGVSTFFIEKEIDTGSIILQEATSIYSDDTAGNLHDRLMIIGANLVLKTVNALQEGKTESIKQEVLMEKQPVLKKAPKIFKEDCKIDWNNSAETIDNFIRGLSPYPGAFTIISSPEGNIYQLKIYKSEIEKTDRTTKPGKIITDQTSFLHITARDGLLSLNEVQLAGKKKNENRSISQRI